MFPSYPFFQSKIIRLICAFPVVFSLVFCEKKVSSQVKDSLKTSDFHGAFHSQTPWQKAFRLCGTDESAHAYWRLAISTPFYTLKDNLTYGELKKELLSGSISLNPMIRNLLFKSIFKNDSDNISLKPRSFRKNWRLISIDQTEPKMKLLRVGGMSPFSDESPYPLDIPLCSKSRDLKQHKASLVLNWNPAYRTVLMMTGVTALTRGTGLLIDRKGPEYLTTHIKKWFEKADFVHISNEVSFRPDCRISGRGMSFCSKENYIKVLESINANIIELTGSHLTDQGSRWFEHSMDMYRKRKWRWFGGGKNQREAQRPLKIHHNGNKIAFIGCNIPRTEQKVIKGGPDTARCQWKPMLDEVRDLRNDGYLPIVSLQHWEVYQYEPLRRMIKEFRRFAKPGAAVVFGSQAHFPHTLEFYKDTFIHYGAGNFFFDQMKKLGTRQGLVDKMYFYKGRLISIEMLPTLIEEYGQPRPMTRLEKKSFLNNIFTLSKKLN